MASRRIRGPLTFNSQRVFTGTGNTTVLNEAVLVITKGTGAATQVTLPKVPSGLAAGARSVLIVDGKGDAATNNITVVPDSGHTINGGSSLVMGENYDIALFVWNGTEWNGGVIVNAVSSTELGFLNGVTAGTVTASKAVVVDANKDIASFRDVTTRKVKVGDSANDNVIAISGAGDESADRALTIPLMGGDKTMALLSTSAGTQAFADRLTTTDGVTSGTARIIGGRATAFTADGTALTNSTTETVLASYSIPASTLKAGSALRVRFMVSVTADAGATTLTVRLRLGATTLTGTALITTTATDTSANHICVGEFYLISQAAPGATAACRGWGNFQEPGAAGGAFKTAVLGTGGVGATFATNGVLLLECTGQWSAADANSCLATYFNVEIL